MDRNLTPLAIITQLGLTIAVSVVAGVVAGLWLDNLLGTKPLLTLVLSFVGVMAGAVAGIRLVNGPGAFAARTTAKRRSPPSRVARDDGERDDDLPEQSTDRTSAKDSVEAKPPSPKSTDTHTEDTEEKA